MKVFAFEWCSCIYESGFSIVSLHTTRAGAFKAMTTEANREWYVERNAILTHGGHYIHRHAPLSDQSWRVRPIELHTDTSANGA